MHPKETSIAKEKATLSISLPNDYSAGELYMQYDVNHCGPSLNAL